MARILLYALNYAPEPVGVGKYTGEIGAHLAAQGHIVRVVTAAPHYPEWEVPRGYSKYGYTTEHLYGADIVRCPLFLRKPMRGVWRFLAPLSFAATSLPVVTWAVLRHRPDIIFCIEPTLFVAPVALFLGRLVNSRTILHVQDLEIDAAFAVGHLKTGIVNYLATAFEKTVLRLFDQIITISGRMRGAIELKGVPSDRIAIVRNWVDLEAIRPLDGPNYYRNEYCWPDSLIVALYAGSIGAKQALQVVLEAAQRLKTRSEILFVIVGEGPAKASLVEKYGNLPNVRFLPPQPEERMCDLLNLADIHLLPQSQGIADLVVPSKLGGMLASGKPILVTADVGSELFDTLTGIAIVVPAGDRDAIVRELSAFAAQGGLHPSIGDGKSLADLMSKDLCLRDLEKIVSSVRP